MAEAGMFPACERVKAVVVIAETYVLGEIPAPETSCQTRIPALEAESVTAVVVTALAEFA